MEATKDDPTLSDAAADLAIEVDDGSGDLAAGIAILMSQVLKRQV